MSFPWYLKPELLLHAEILDKQEELDQAASASYSRDQEQDKQIGQLNRRVSELEQQLLALEKLLSEQGILPSPAVVEEKLPEPHTPGTPAVFPARTEKLITCPCCGKQQKGNRNLCFFCETPFRYENE